MDEKQFIEHLEDLRGCVIKSCIGIAGGFAVTIVFVPHIFTLLLKPYRDCLAHVSIPAETVLRSLGPADTLQLTMKIALIFGFGLASPWIAYQVWKFVSPALHNHEKKYVTVFCGGALTFFLAGAFFAYSLVLPPALSFFYTYTSGLGITPDWAIVNYYDFIVSFIVGFGLVFELPIVVVILSLLGVVTPESLAAYRKHVIVGIFILAGIITPSPDVISQLMMGIPMVLLYEFSIFAVKLMRRQNKHLPAENI